ncbi:hypothetical protein METHPM2_1900001 [Pseudomonas sp. PM2]
MSRCQSGTIGGRYLNNGYVLNIPVGWQAAIAGKPAPTF